MTAEQFIQMLNTKYGMHTKWPLTYEVDAETYALCCQEVFKQAEELGEWYGFTRKVKVAIGKYNGIMFKNVELILKT